MHLYFYQHAYKKGIRGIFTKSVSKSVLGVVSLFYLLFCFPSILLCFFNGGKEREENTVNLETVFWDFEANEKM